MTFCRGRNRRVAPILRRTRRRTRRTRTRKERTGRTEWPGDLCQLGRRRRQRERRRRDARPEGAEARRRRKQKGRRDNATHLRRITSRTRKTMRTTAEEPLQASATAFWRHNTADGAVTYAITTTASLIPEPGQGKLAGHGRRRPGGGRRRAASRCATPRRTAGRSPARPAGPHCGHPVASRPCGTRGAHDGTAR